MDARNVTELTEISTITDTDNLLVGRSNSLLRITFANVKSLLWSLINVVANIATTTTSGLMSAADKLKLDAIDNSLKNKTVSDMVVDSSAIIVSGKGITSKFSPVDKSSCYNVSEAVTLTDCKIYGTNEILNIQRLVVALKTTVSAANYVSLGNLEIKPKQIIRFTGYLLNSHATQEGFIDASTGNIALFCPSGSAGNIVIDNIMYFNK